MLWLLVSSLFATTDSISHSRGEPLLMLNLTGSNHNLIGLEAGGGWGAKDESRGSSRVGVFGSVEPGWRGWRLRTGMGVLAAGEGGIAVWRMGLVGLSEGWSTCFPAWGPELTLGLNLILVRAGMAFGETKPVRFLWSAGVGF